MIIRGLTLEHDWKFGHGLSDFDMDEKAIDTNIQTRLLSWVGNAFFALQEGVDWRNRLEIGQQEALREEIAAVILQSFGVIGINSIELDFNGVTRLAIIRANIQTIFSPSFQTTIEQAAGI